jgi:hypothetical protein
MNLGPFEIVVLHDVVEGVNMVLDQFVELVDLACERRRAPW